jgi:hypothetical protein
VPSTAHREQGAASHRAVGCGDSGLGDGQVAIAKTKGLKVIQLAHEKTKFIMKAYDEATGTVREAH